MRRTHVAGALFLASLVSGPAHSPAAGTVVFAVPESIADRGPMLDLEAAAGLAATVDLLPMPDSGDSGPGKTRREDEHRDQRDATAQRLARARYSRDLEAMQLYRPGYRFWRHVFTIPNGRMAYGSAADGDLLATFPLGRNWSRDAHWEESSLADLLAAEPPGGGLAERRDETALLLAQVAGPVVYHETRGSFIEEGAEQYGAFLDEWGAIFERFGVPAEIGLAQGLAESGLRGRVSSDAGAIGFCQWLPRNWERLQELSQHVIEVHNQTTQVPYCAAHLAVLATKYGSLIPALSEHHAGGVNVGRAIINGDFAGGEDVRARYFLGAELTLLVRRIRPPGYREVVGGYGPRSFLYAEMVFGNTLTIDELRGAIPQEPVFAMRPSRSVPFEEVAQRTGLSTDEIRRFNPALINRVPAGANLYLPSYEKEFGPDTAFWHRPATPEYLDVLSEFLRLEEQFSVEDWHDGSVFEALHEFESRFQATETEEGEVMAVVIAYSIDELSDGQQLKILTDVRDSERAHRLLEQGVRQREALLKVADGTEAGWARRNALLTTTVLD
ncbi:MAG: hypothetical protein ACWGPN_10235 [Gammaproteobacteria bacterium]